MNLKKRTQDLTDVFDSHWNVNHNYKERKEFLDSRKEHLDKMYDVKGKKTQRKEILWINSVDGQIEKMNKKIDAVVSNDRIVRRNDFKNNFR